MRRCAILTKLQPSEDRRLTMRASPLWRRQPFAMTRGSGIHFIEDLFWNSVRSIGHNGRQNNHRSHQRTHRQLMASLHGSCRVCCAQFPSQALRFPEHKARVRMSFNLGGSRTMAGGPKNRPKKHGKKSSSGSKQPRPKTKRPPKVNAPPSTPEVPPAYLMPTASPFVYVASCAAMEFDIDSKSLFADVMSTDLMPPTFATANFGFMNPKSFGDKLSAWNIPEVAFLGRSNVGKSSLINALMRKDLARCSKHPGRTQQVNYFALVHRGKFASEMYHPSDATGFLVDLPGYGYAKAPEENVDRWQKNTQQFLMDRRDAEAMRNVYCLVDARRGMTQIDRTVMGWFDDAAIPYSIVLTKADKVGRPQLVRFINDVCMRYHSQLYGEDDVASQSPIVHITSAKTGEGLRELMSSIEAEFSALPDKE